MSTVDTEVDVAIIGAGVIGCALASRLSRFSRVALIERNDAPGLETTARNSGVLHSGIHLPPASNKAVLARRGKQLTEAYAARMGLEWERVGMHIIVASEDVLGLWPETRRLVAMLGRAKRQGIRVELVTGKMIRRREPCVRGIFGLYLPEVSIINTKLLTVVLWCDTCSQRTEQMFGQSVTGLRSVPGGWHITTTKTELLARSVINAAGLYADQVAALAGFTYRQFFYRGEYYRIRPESGLVLNGLVYPVHRPGKPGLGVHLTRTTNGTMLIGPNATRVAGPEDYDTNPTPPEPFYQDVKAFLPDLDLAHLTPHPAGIRPKLTDTPGENDFKIVWENTPAPFLNLIGMESPGLTAAMAIAEDADLELRNRLAND